MWQPLQKLLGKFNLWRYQHNIKKALALHLRGEARTDGLTADTVSSHLTIRWRARDIHHWDRHRPRYERELMFAEQALTDTEAAVERLFDRLPGVDVIDLSVVEPVSEVVIAAGTVRRSDLSAPRPRLSSVGMRLRELGIRYCFAVPADSDFPEHAPTCDLVRGDRSRHNEFPSLGGGNGVAYVIAEPCISTKDTACVDVCPVDCIHTKEGRSRVRGGRTTLHSTVGMHRLRCLRSGLSGHRNFRSGRLA
jgi:NAD-dependent dihydropyrimidine dehydrogenase PreA subunit